MDGDSTIKQKARIKEKAPLTKNIYRITLETRLCSNAKPGQFVMVYPPDGAMLLGRPVCIADASDKMLSIVFRVIGSGTQAIASLDEGDFLEIEGPLGNGYPDDTDTMNAKEIVLLGGGLGAPSLLFLARSLIAEGKKPTVILGYRDSKTKLFLSEDFRILGADTIIATEDGSAGVCGNVLDALKNHKIDAGLIYACGPMPMLAAVKEYAFSHRIKAYISLEEHMACGVGVCLGCVVKTGKKDAHSNVCNARVCTEGPVFEAQTVKI